MALTISPRILDAAVGNDPDAPLIGLLGAIHDGGHLGNADAGHHASGADGAGSDADLDAVGAGARSDPRTASGVATLPAMTGHVGKQPLNGSHHFQHVAAMAMCRIDEPARPRLASTKRLRPVERIAAATPTAAPHSRRPVVVLRAVGILATAFSISLMVIRPLSM